MPIIRTGFIFLVELIDLMNTLIFWSHANLDFRFLIQIQDCDLQSPALQNFFISSDHSTYSTFAFPPQGNSNHVVAVFIDFLSNAKGDATFHCTFLNYSCTDQDGLHLYKRCSMGDYLYTGCFCRYFQSFLTCSGWNCLYTPHKKYQVMSHSYS